TPRPRRPGCVAGTLRGGAPPPPPRLGEKSPGGRRPPPRPGEAKRGQVALRARQRPTLPTPTALKAMSLSGADRTGTAAPAEGALAPRVRSYTIRAASSSVGKRPFGVS